MLCTDVRGWFVVVCCSLFVACCVVVVCFSLLDISRLLCAMCKCAVRGLLPVAGWLFYVVWCSSMVVRCLLCVVC